MTESVVVFRTDASPEIGIGHLTRCRALALALKQRGLRNVMIGPDSGYAKAEDQETFDDWVPVPEWVSGQEDAISLLRLAKQHQASWLVLDDYRIDEDYQLSMRAAGMHWLQWDGSASKSLWADIVVNASPAACSKSYAKVLRNPHARLLLGPEYAILRPEFQQIKPRGLSRSVKQVLLTFGGGYDRGANELILSTLLPVTSLEQQFVVLSGATNPSNQRLKQWIEVHGEGRVSLHVDPEHVSPLFFTSDLAVMAGGTSTYEAAACGLPMLIITIADNQISQAKSWHSIGNAYYIGELDSVEPEQIMEGFDKIKKITFESNDKNAEGVVDGCGAMRVSSELISRLIFGG